MLFIRRHKAIYLYFIWLICFSFPHQTYAEQSSFEQASFIVKNCENHKITYLKKYKTLDLDKDGKPDARSPLWSKLIIKNETGELLFSKEFSIHIIAEAKCINLVEDQEPELLVQGYTYGAHCCTKYSIFKLTFPIDLIFEFEAKEADIIRIRDLNNDGQKELLIGDFRFAYFGDLCFACSPVLPYYFCFKEGKEYSECSRDFPNLLVKELNESLDQFGQIKNTNQDPRKLSLKIIAISYMLGQNQIWWEYFENRLSKENFEWLSSHRLKIEKMMRERK